MRKNFIPAALIFVLVIGALLTGCGGGTAPETESQDVAKTGTLEFRANGEDFIRQGFVSKDGWALAFDHVYVTLADVTAYQASPPYDPDKGGDVQAKVKVSLPGTHTVDLAEGDENAPPILVGEVKDAPAGHYNAISWKMIKAPEGPAEGYALVIIGKAEKEGRTIDFNIKFDQQYAFTGGEYVGDQRKGILEENGTADLEMTFHFDHIFGDAETPADDELNVGALGFEPFAALAENGKVDADTAALKARLSPADYQKLEEVLPTLGHVGEGHCHCEAI
ncbi:MAG: hypothetical protein XD69_0652 [Clostridia bacterium 62_21]|nr:MAG: hypothetical protein XD69_0652 [Clostridia bacterium 62_21]HAG07085.1 DUF4382 domain-containing protein [Peptococcaceae bacterium]